MNRRASPYLRYAYNDLVRNKGVNTALAVVLTLSAFLMATGFMVTERLVGSVNQLFDEARPPHFLQMHKGDHDQEALDRFAAEHPEIDAWLVEEMLGFDGSGIAWRRASTGESGTFSDSLIDNLVVTQNQEFDFLLDEAGGVPRPSPGEVYAPVDYRHRYGLRVGDDLRIMTDTGVHDLRVQGFVRDAQMASSLSSATRFLVSETDFEHLGRAGGGAPEIIVEYRLADPSSASAFQRSYESDQALPKNGQAVTFEMIRLLNALGDGLLAVALVFASLVLIAIALLSLRFVIRGTLEDEVREIGAMKAVGLPDRAIAGLYLSKYSVMTLLACVVGGVLAVAAADLLTRSIRVNFAEAPPGAASFLAPVVALALVYLFVMAVCRGVLRGVTRIQVVNALVHGSALDERQTARRAQRQARRARRTGLTSYRGGVNGRLALVDLRVEGRRWALIPVVFFLASVLMTLPANLLSTFESPRFVTYMGSPESDLRADLQFSDDVDAVREDMLARMRDDDRLTDVRVLAHVLGEVEGEEGTAALRVEVGDHSAGTVEFLEGGRPGPGQIALSVLNADRYRVSTGDEMVVRTGGEPARLTVSGIYQDVTSGGHTAKMQGEVTSGAVGYVIHANVREGTAPAAVADDYGELFPTATVIPMREFVRQTMSYVTGAFQGAAVLSFVFGVGVALLITVLFLQLVLSRDRRKIGVLSAVGFSGKEIVGQVRVKTLVTVVSGTLLGLVFAATVGESLVGALISLAGLGITELHFIPNPLLAYVAYPLFLIGAGYLGAVVLTARIRDADKSSWLEG